MKVIHNLRMDLARCGCRPIVSAVQGEGNTRALEVALYDNGVAWAVPEGVTAAVAFKKPDGRCGLYDTLPDGSPATAIAGSVVTATLAPQALTAAGDVLASIVFYDEQLNQLATFPFRIRVEANPAAGQAVSSDYYNYTTMADVNAAVDAALADMEAAKQEVLAKGAPPIICEESGEMIAVHDASDRLLHGLTLYGKTTQYGTPSPETPVELVSAGVGGSIGVTVAGKNLFYPDWWGTKNEDGTFSITGLSGGAVATLTGKIPAGTYTLSYLQGRGTCYLQIGSAEDYNLTLAIGGTKTFQYDGCSYLRILCSNVPADTTVTYKIQLEAGAAATAFEPYKEQTLTAATPNGLPGIPVASGGNYTDENGQAWVCDEIDFARGVYVQRVCEYTCTGAEAISAFGSANTKGYCRWNMLLGITDTETANYANNGKIVPSLSNKYTAYSADALSALFNSTGEGYGFAFVNDSRVVFSTTSTVLADFIAEITGTKILYQLAAPVETALPAEELAAYAALHSNKPTTTVYNDAGAGQAVEYVADTKTYIDQKLAAISAAMLNA